ncbi:unnamed protein product [Zymoseptoria tritici ST99CH_1A5]|uniref:(S)-ureidoglycine aminohydrolase cupin domain-containing protein n=4 Tax=Zymoseptoria tritici TaxID=1047171 RepID=F9XJT4_ZYMTI|nr:uncharacterized protein MYCGRDRAFT_47480 [Zymoseptoria tritici IPO323]SMQ53786.1 unnamed protein product [Zymoseptoria tritici ST99CH_3D7]SMR58221.1 unnamed protein product [Zymoseptoria tritici ST99CH_1E4]SMR61198.1 unnamed protein product [Zymoseptoria tritici ST99CH_3D1]SMY27419.1 unnamed protein product [Zymoseptoria tritici ST99CH_1A5]EGP84242.1 hypothetical protein MYCGRDRAFT_47480 [Zymoseptoria tritici IPO323]
MPVDFQSATERFKIPEAFGSHVFFRDIAGTKDADRAQDRLVGIWFRIEKGPEVGPGIHGYDECGVVWEGTVTLRDEIGNERTLGPGESFFIHRGSEVKFSSTDYGVCYKAAARPQGKL